MVKSKMNKNAFQWDVYHPLQWSYWGCLPKGGCLPRECLPTRVCLPKEGVCLGSTPRPCGQTDACEKFTVPQLLLSDGNNDKCSVV